MCEPSPHKNMSRKQFEITDNNFCRNWTKLIQKVVLTDSVKAIFDKFFKKDIEMM